MCLLGYGAYRTVLDQLYQRASEHRSGLTIFCTFAAVSPSCITTNSRSPSWLTAALFAASAPQELLDLQDSGARGLLLDTLQKQAGELGSAAAAMPRRIQRIDTVVEQLESGDLKLRVRVLEAERAARRAGIMQARACLRIAVPW